MTQEEPGYGSLHRDAPKDTLESKQRLMEQTHIAVFLWDKGFICVNNSLLLHIKSIATFVGKRCISSADKPMIYLS